MGRRRFAGVQPEPPFFLFDGDCGFCRAWVNWLERRLPPDTCFVPFQHVDDLGAYGLTPDDVVTASYWISSDGTPHGGARSFAHALRTGTLPWSALGIVLDLPLVGTIADRLYPVIARHRHQLPAPDAPHD